MHAGALQSLSVGARAAWLSDFRHNGFDTTACADRIPEAFAEIIVVGILTQFRLKVILPDFGRHEFRTARADLQVQATALVPHSSHHLTLAAATAVRLTNATAESRTNLRLHRLWPSAIANGILQAWALIRVFHFGRFHGFSRARRMLAAMHMMTRRSGTNRVGIAICDVHHGFTFRRITTSRSQNGLAISGQGRGRRGNKEKRENKHDAHGC